VGGNAIGHEESDVVRACIGDVPTQETIAAAALLHVPHVALVPEQPFAAGAAAVMLGIGAVAALAASAAFRRRDLMGA